MTDNDAFSRMEAYLSGTMDAAERMQFENDLAKDPVLKQQLHMFTQVQDTLTHSIQNQQREQALQHTLSQIKKEYRKPAAVAPVYNMRKWYYAAAAVLLVTGTLLFINKNGEKDTQSLYAEYAVFPTLSTVRGAADTLTTNTLAYYNNKHFGEAATGFETILSKDSSNLEARMNLYLSYLQNNNVQRALDGFVHLTAYQNVYSSQAQWYAALAYLKLNNKNACKQTLLTILPGTDTYSKAQELLKELN